MAYESCQTCQFCEKVNGFTGRNQPSEPSKYVGKVKYGTRHYAHYACFLAKKGESGLRSLHAWQVAQFPYMLLKEYGYTNVAREIVEADEK